MWDARHSKILLSSMDIKGPREMTFSSDGCFFACGTAGPEIYLWKDSPTGYTLHQTLMPSVGFCKPLLSPDGRFILTFKGRTLQLWYTTETITPLSSIPTQASQSTRPFVLGFSPDESSAAVARLEDNTATVLDLRSGVPRLTIDAGTRIYGLGVAGSTVVVVVDGKVVTWNLPQMDPALDPVANINDSIRTTIFDRYPLPDSLPSASISPDFNHIAIAGVDVRGFIGLNIYDMATGKYLAGTPSTGGMPWFTPDGREIWCCLPDKVQGWSIVRDGESDFLKMEHLGQTQPERYPWTPPRGHKFTDDGWMLNSSGKRLLWLPPHWRLPEKNRMWNGRFLAFLHHELPEAIILEVLEE